MNLASAAVIDGCRHMMIMVLVQKVTILMTLLLLLLVVMDLMSIAPDGGGRVAVDWVLEYRASSSSRAFLVVVVLGHLAHAAAVAGYCCCRSCSVWLIHHPDARLLAATARVDLLQSSVKPSLSLPLPALVLVLGGSFAARWMDGWKL
jgi:hypothetical protein